MLKDILRIIGAACIIAGASLYFMNDIPTDSEALTDNSKLKAEISSLQSELEKTTAELANLQTIGTDAQKSTDEIQTKSKNSVTKTVLVIKSGTSSKEVANQLAQSAIIEEAALLNDYLTAHQLSGKIQIGEYALDSSMSIEEIAKQITTLQ